MSFIQSCFIRKNTPELRKKLEDLGYNKSEFGSDLNNSIATTSINASYTCIKEQFFDDTDPYTTWGLKFRIDCGDNELLFLALAALRDDNDYLQWFVSNRKEWILCEKPKWHQEYITTFGFREWHKATVEELIEHFKTK